jgi:hypothetical protein
MSTTEDGLRRALPKLAHRTPSSDSPNRPSLGRPEALIECWAPVLPPESGDSHHRRVRVVRWTVPLGVRGQPAPRARRRRGWNERDRRPSPAPRRSRVPRPRSVTRQRSRGDPPRTRRPDSGDGWRAGLRACADGCRSRPPARRRSADWRALIGTGGQPQGPSGFVLRHVLWKPGFRLPFAPAP